MAKFDVTEMLVDTLVTALIFGALFPIVNSSINDMGLDNITIFGTAYDWSFAGYLLALAIILGIVFYAVRQIKKK